MIEIKYTGDALWERLNELMARHREKVKGIDLNRALRRLARPLQTLQANRNRTV